MATNEDRIAYLKEKLSRLSSRIQEANLEDKYIEMVDQIAQGKLTVEPIDDDQWELMLPKEQEKHLLAYYHTRRAELQEMKRLYKEKGRTGKLREWLENPWVKVGLTGLALVEVATKVLEALHHGGLFFQDESDTDYLV